MDNTRVEVIAKTDDLVKAVKSIMGFKVDQDKSKYIWSLAEEKETADPIVGDYAFQAVSYYKYLDTNMIKSNNMLNEIVLRVSVADLGCFALVKPFKSKLLSTSSKINLHTLAIYVQSWNMVVKRFR